MGMSALFAEATSAYQKFETSGGSTRVAKSVMARKSRPNGTGVEASVAKSANSRSES